MKGGRRLVYRDTTNPVTHPVGVGEIKPSWTPKCSTISEKKSHRPPSMILVSFFLPEIRFLLMGGVDVVGGRFRKFKAGLLQPMADCSLS